MKIKGVQEQALRYLFRICNFGIDILAIRNERHLVSLLFMIPSSSGNTPGAIRGYSEEGK
jgi:hypothetical protein